MTFLVLASASDTTAIEVGALLARRHGAEQVRMRTPDEIVLAPYWEHRVCNAGAHTNIEMHDGVFPARPSIIFNRLQGIESFPLQHASTADREYAHAELSALLLSWLSSIDCPVMNRPSPSGLAGCIRRPLAWRRLAARAGLSTVALHLTTSTRRFPVPAGSVPRPDLSWQDRSLLPGFRVNQFSWYSEPVGQEVISVHVLGDRALGDAPASVLENCLRLAKLAELDFLRVDLVKSSNEPLRFAFAGADACPRVNDGGVIAALADLLETMASRQPAATVA